MGEEKRTITSYMGKRRCFICYFTDKFTRWWLRRYKKITTRHRKATKFAIKPICILLILSKL
jgi:hypothetical protein